MHGSPNKWLINDIQCKKCTFHELGPFQKIGIWTDFLVSWSIHFRIQMAKSIFLLDVLKLCLRKNTARNKDDIRHLIPMFIGTP